MALTYRLLGVASIVAGGLFIATPTGAVTPSILGAQVFCVTATSSGTGLCPPGSPTIVGATALPRDLLGPENAAVDLSTTATGMVYTEGSGLVATLGNLTLAAPIVGIAADPVRGQSGIWLVGADGGVFALDGAPFLGSAVGLHLNAPIVGIVATPTTGSPGYWLVGADGGVFAFGSAKFYGSMGGTRLNAPVVGMAAVGDGGYFLTAADGGVFTFGDAVFEGSMAGVPLDAPVVAIALVSADAYDLAGSDGGIFTFGPGAYFNGFKGVVSAPVIAESTWSGSPSSPAESPWGYPTVVTSNGDRFGLP